MNVWKFTYVSFVSISLNTNFRQYEFDVLSRASEGSVDLKEWTREDDAII